MNDIKKAFEQMKKDLFKETGIKGGFVMNKKQIENRTATYLLTNHFWSYEEDIRRERESDAKVQKYNSWTDEEKANSHERSLKRIEAYEDLIRRYGTKENCARVLSDKVVNSKAFSKFQETVGKTKCFIEDMNDCYYLRFIY